MLIAGLVSVHSRAHHRKHVVSVARIPWADERFIYAIREDRKGGLIKIGTATNVPRRMREIQKMCARPLKLAGVELWVGDHARFQEAMIHHVLSAHRAKPHIIMKRGLHGRREWFHPRDEVLAFIANWPVDIEQARTCEPLRSEIKDMYPGIQMK